VIDVQDIGPDDWKTWRELRLAALEEAPYAFGSRLADWVDASEDRWRERLSAPGAYQVVAALDGTPVGMAGGFLADEPGLAHLVSMWVAPAGRGRGVGDRLMTAVEERARGAGAHTLELSVAVGNDAAHALYLRSGFTDDREVEEPATDGVLERLTMMRKQL
jgi:ribosomal protein S18 acetylase RimI-like enzyme